MKIEHANNDRFELDETGKGLAKISKFAEANVSPDTYEQKLWAVKQLLTKLQSNLDESQKTINKINEYLK